MNLFRLLGEPELVLLSMRELMRWCRGLVPSPVNPYSFAQDEDLKCTLYRIDSRIVQHLTVQTERSWHLVQVAVPVLDCLPDSIH